MSRNIRERGTSYCLIRYPYRQKNKINHLYISDTTFLRKFADFRRVGYYSRTDPNAELPMRDVCTSVFECADYCLRNTMCAAYEYSITKSICKIYDKPALPSFLAADSARIYFEIDELNFYI